MKTIWKYELKIVDKQVVDMPDSAGILSVAEQHGKLCMWAAVDSSAPKRERVLYVAGTGGPLPGGMGADDATVLYVGTALIGSLVWHVFDRGWRA